jgi:solute carrier family 4 anion exchanger 2
LICSQIDLKEETYTSSSEDLDKRIQKEKESIMRRIPAGAEATTVLVGTVDFLQEPAIAFVRLAEGIFLPAVTEVSVESFLVPHESREGVIVRSILTILPYRS